jgi:glutaredoxin 2
MTLFTKDDCKLCDQLKKRFNLMAMEVKIEILGNNDAAALAHLAWHGLVDTARKSLPILVLDDSSTIAEFSTIENHLTQRAMQYGIKVGGIVIPAACEGGSCSLN